MARSDSLQSGGGSRAALALATADRRLVVAIDRGFHAAAARAGTWLACRPGCDACCIGPFPITRLDAWRLRQGLDDLARREPARAAAVVERAREAAEALTPGFPGQTAGGRLCADEAGLDPYFERHAARPCPALDPATRRCELYAFRPISCRTYGPPARFDGQRTPPCDLCFRGASAATVERCRYEPDPAGLEPALLAAAGLVGEADWETLIAFALARPGAGWRLELLPERAR